MVAFLGLKALSLMTVVGGWRVQSAGGRLPRDSTAQRKLGGIPPLPHPEPTRQRRQTMIWNPAHTAVSWSQVYRKLGAVQAMRGVDSRAYWKMRVRRHAMETCG